MKRTARSRARSDFSVDQEKAGGARGEFGANCGADCAGASWSGTAPLEAGGRKETVQRTVAAAVFPLPSHSERLPQPQTWPGPGGQAGDQAWRSAKRPDPDS